MCIDRNTCNGYCLECKHERLHWKHKTKNKPYSIEVDWHSNWCMENTGWRHWSSFKKEVDRDHEYDKMIRWASGINSKVEFRKIDHLEEKNG